MHKQPTPEQSRLEQKTAAAERRNQCRALAQQIAAMTDAQRAQMLARIGAVPTCEGRPLSAFNSCLLLKQKDDVSLVDGFQQWRAVGRQVRKGERGLFIWFPKSNPNAEPTPDQADDKIAFLLGYVFDITQMEETTQ